MRCRHRAGLAPTPVPRLAVGRGDGVGTIARPPDMGPSVISAPGAATRVPSTSSPSSASARATSAPDAVARVDANATVARPVVKRDAPVLPTGDDDAVDVERRRTLRRRASVGLAVAALAAVVVGVVVVGGGGDESATPTSSVREHHAAARRLLRRVASAERADRRAGNAERTGYIVSYEMPEAATEVEVEVVSGSIAGELSAGTGEPIEFRDGGPDLVRGGASGQRLGPALRRRRPRLLRLNSGLGRTCDRWRVVSRSGARRVRRRRDRASRPR